MEMINLLLLSKIIVLNNRDQNISGQSQSQINLSIFAIITNPYIPGIKLEKILDQIR